MVVNDLQNLRLFQTGNRLGRFIVIHQNHPFPPGTQQMLPGENTHHPVGAIQNRVAVLLLFQNLLPDIVQTVLQMKGRQALGPADPPHRRGLENQPQRPVSVIRSHNHAGAAVLVQRHQRPGLRLADNQTIDLLFQRPGNHIRLIAAEDNGILPVEQQIFPALGQRNGHLSGNHISAASLIIEKPSLQHRKQIEHRHRPQIGAGNQTHIEAGHIILAEHAK